MAPKERVRTVLDALEDALGAKPEQSELRKLTIAELDTIADRLSQFWKAQSVEPVADGSSLIGGFHSAYGSTPALRADLSDSLLYYPRVLLFDPIADYFDGRSALPEPHPIRYRRQDGVYNSLQAGPALWSQAGSYQTLRQDPEGAAVHFATLVKNLYALEGPIRDGVTVLRSQWPVLAARRPQLDAAVRHDIASNAMQEFVEAISPDQIGPTSWDNLRGMQISMDGPVHKADIKWRNEPYFYYLNKMLAIADAYDSQYVPATQQDLQLLRTKVTAGVHRAHPEGMLREVSRFLLPSIEIPLREASALRKSSENFEEWRVALRDIQREASGDSPDELRERVDDTLRPSVNRVRRDLASSSFKELVRTDGVDLIIDAAVGFGAAAGLTHEPLWGVATGATTGVLHWIRRAYIRPRPGGADAVLATLLRAADRIRLS